MSATRYVVLHHTGFGEPHYDLMFESSPGGTLTTFRAPDWPPVAGDALTRLGDHRRAYLDYEGPVSNNRGEVKRAASGTCEVSIATTQMTIRLVKPQALLLLLRLEKDDRWLVVEVDQPA